MSDKLREAANRLLNEVHLHRIHGTLPDVAVDRQFAEDIELVAEAALASPGSQPAPICKNCLCDGPPKNFCVCDCHDAALASPGSQAGEQKDWKGVLWRDSVAASNLAEEIALHFGHDCKCDEDADESNCEFAWVETKLRDFLDTQAAAGKAGRSDG